VRIFDVVVIGNVTVDHVLTMVGPPPRGDKAYASALSAYPGGQAANAAYTMAGLGLSVRFVGRFGEDAAGRASWNSLVEAGCDLTGSVLVEGCPHNFAVVMVDSGTGERSIVTHCDARLSMPPDALAPGLFADVRAFYTDGTQPSASLRGLRLARDVGAMTIADAESHAGWLSQALPWLDELIAPNHVLLQLAGRAHETPDGELFPPAELLESITRRGPRTVVATAGAAGCTALVANSATTSIFVQAQEIRPLDTTGAGDAFHGGYVTARLRGLRPRRALEFATAVAAAACATAGPRTAMDRLHELAGELMRPRTPRWKGAGTTGG
jgi:sugar/nucleoside kinase (ribokinase family)